MKKLCVCLGICAAVFGLVNIENDTAVYAKELPMQQEHGGVRLGDVGSSHVSNRGGMAVETDEKVLSTIAENADKFKQMKYRDELSGISLEYSLYIPQGDSKKDKLPMVIYIPDATGAGKTAKQIVEQYYGADVWASDEEQQKHPAFVLVPAFSGVVTDDDWNTSEQIETAVDLIEQLCRDYPIDRNRLYITGQSMGCMTSLYLNGKYPNMFAASLFVSGQWDIAALKPLEDKPFFYITAAGDDKASGGQSEVMQMFDEDKIGYSYGQWNAQDSAEAQNSYVAKLLAQNHQANFIRFDLGTVLKDGNQQEHMASFNYAYKLSAVRDWLFAQSL